MARDARARQILSLLTGLLWLALKIYHYQLDSHLKGALQWELMQSKLPLRCVVLSLEDSSRAAKTAV